jgi:hypothetical protein
MNGLQDIQTPNQQANNGNNNEMQQQQQRLDQLYGYNTEDMNEEQRQWWEKFLQFLRESKERDMARYRQQVI